ncbi:hypothetical protein [Pandoraea pnomenusa]|uniref:hypothetical protein n=1 Tax=Pandoraea pnomenusa TaxID=93220 RepID=UPI0033417BD1
MSHDAHAMAGHAGAPTPAAANQHATHGAASTSGQEATASAAMGHAMPPTPAPGSVANPHAGHQMPGASK